VLIRPARSEDIEEVLALWSDAEAEPTHTDDAASLQLLLRHDPGSLLVAELDGRLVGTVISGWDGWRGSIYRLAVHPRHRRQGLARQLLSEAESRLTKLGAKRMQAIVVASDQRAAGFWTTSGWDEQVDRLRFVKG
jgi:ribosomal protein S18 acetylase RimI-like enzyme